MTAASLLALARLLLQVAGAIAAGLRDRRLMDAGAARAMLDGVRDADHAISQARAARAAVQRDAGGMRDDPDNRDNDL